MILEQAYTPIVIIVAGALSVGFVFYDFQVAPRVEKTEIFKKV